MKERSKRGDSVDRRSFLGLLALFFLPKTVPADERNRVLMLNRCCVAGLQYHPGVGLSLKSGEPVTMRREPENPYDANAVALFAKGVKLGYIPKRENTTLAMLLDQNARLRARVETFDAEARSWERVKIVVEQVI